MAYTKIVSRNIGSTRKDICDTIAGALQRDFDIKADKKRISDYIDYLLIEYTLIPNHAVDSFRNSAY